MVTLAVLRYKVGLRTENKTQKGALAGYYVTGLGHNLVPRHHHIARLKSELPNCLLRSAFFSWGWNFEKKGRRYDCYDCFCAVALLSAKIQNMSGHMRGHRKDFASRR